MNTPIADKLLEEFNPENPKPYFHKAREQVALLENEIACQITSATLRDDAWFTALVRAYTIAYKHGHEDTVEARYVDVVQSEETTYFNDTVHELVNDNAVMPELADAMRPTSGQRILEENRRLKVACESSLTEFRALTGYLHSHNMISPQTRMVINQLKEALNET